MFDGRFRDRVDKTTTPVGAWLVKKGASADVLTGLGLVFAIATAIAVGSGHLLLGAPLLVLTGFPDLLDGPVAKAAGTSSVRGAFFDSVTDRISDALLLGGVSWYLISFHHGQVAILPLAVLAASSIVSYERAKAEALGIGGAKGGVMERAERMILLGIGFFASFLLIPVLCVLLALTVATAVGRFLRVWKAAEGPAVSAFAVRRAQVPEESRWRKGRVESRWRAWRESAVTRRTTDRMGEPLGRWRARREEALASRSGRARRARRTSRDSASRHSS